MRYRVKWIIEKQYPNSDETYLETITKYFTDVEIALEVYWKAKEIQENSEKKVNKVDNEKIKEIHLDGIIKIKESIAN